MLGNVPLKQLDNLLPSQFHFLRYIMSATLRYSTYNVDILEKKGSA